MEQKEKKPELHLMVDIETMGTTPDSMILSCAVVPFTLDGSDPGIAIVDDGYWHINAVSSLIYHRLTDYDTEEWWRKPERKEARQQVLGGQRHSLTISEFSTMLYGLLNDLTERYEVYFWGRGVATFDMPIISSTLRAVIGEKYVQPWQYWQLMDVRSIFRWAKWHGFEPKKIDTPHDALADCQKQIREVQEVWCFFHGGAGCANIKTDRS